MSEPEPINDSRQHAPREISGRWVVLGLLALGLTATLGLYLYWHFETREFRPLTEAIGREFKYSLPRVEGGRPKHGPATLRIVLRVDFDPEIDKQQFQQTVQRVIELARHYQDLSKYERLEIHLIQLRAEQDARTRTFSKPTEELLRDTEPATGEKIKN